MFSLKNKFLYKIYFVNVVLRFWNVLIRVYNNDSTIILLEKDAHFYINQRVLNSPGYLTKLSE